ncbi:MAG: glycosyltransferase [Syntrophobacterales bacterium]|nr:glycosyltransferase [Syntrophobacterales bacterium]
MKSSIIISFYERLKYLKACLDSLSSNSGDFDEVVIADDGSGESCVRELRGLIKSYDFPIVHAWHRDEGFRLAASRNNGIKRASGDYLIFLDCDFMVLPGTIEYHLNAARRGRFVAGFCKYLSEEQTNKIFQTGVSNTLLEESYSSLPEKPIVRDHRNFVRHRILYSLHLAGARKQRCSSHFSIHRADMEYINGYDENFVGWGGEDEDLAIRFAKAGFQGKSIMREARALHLWHPSEIKNRDWENGPNIEYIRRKHIPWFCDNGLTKTRIDNKTK